MFGGEFDNFLGWRLAELTDRVENKLDPWALSRAKLFLEYVVDGAKVCADILFAQQHYTDREGDLGIHYALLSQVAAGVFGKVGVVVRFAEKRSRPFVEFEELREAACVVTLMNFGVGEFDSIFFCELGNPMGTERAFQMKVEFGFRQLPEETFQIGIGCHALAQWGKEGLPALIQAVSQ